MKTARELEQPRVIMTGIVLFLTALVLSISAGDIKNAAIAYLAPAALVFASLHTVWFTGRELSFVIAATIFMRFLHLPIVLIVIVDAVLLFAAVMLMDFEKIKRQFFMAGFTIAGALVLSWKYHSGIVQFLLLTVVSIVLMVIWIKWFDAFTKEFEEAKREYYEKKKQGESPQEIIDTNYFDGCSTKQEFTKRYHQLSKKLHPDNGGDKEEFIRMQQEYLLKTGQLK